MDHGTDLAAAKSSSAPDTATAQHQEPAASVTIHRSAKGPTLATTTGAVVVVCGKNDGDHVLQQYQPQSTAAAMGTERAALGGSAPSGATKSAFFLAVLAPSADAAMQFLGNRPAGAHLLVKDEDENLAVYVKFRQAVRAIVLVKAKELRKQGEAIVWGRPYRSPPETSTQGTAQLPHTHSTMMTPVHRLYLPAELHTSLEQCWKRFLPQVKAILLQMCCEPYLNEDIRLDDWGAVTSTAQTPCIVALTANSCGFYLIGTNSGAAAAAASNSSSSGSNSGSNNSSNGVVAVRHVEFDFQRHVIFVADGTFNPSAFIVSTHFSSKKLFDADITFKTLRDNFLAPDRVMIKETSVATAPVQQTTWQNCVELNSSDPELTLLATLQSVCWGIIPHEPLSDLLLDALRNLHLLFAESYALDKCHSELTGSAAATPATWPKEKVRMAAQISPYLLELLVAAASGLETIEATTSCSHRNVHKVSGARLFPEQKLKLLHQFARVMRFDIVHMVTRCDDAMLYKFAHHIFQFYSMRCDLPAEFIELVRDLLVLAPEFRALFLKNQGANLLWKALHTGERFQLGSDKSIAGISPLAHAIMQANAQTPKPKAAAERRSSLFGIGKKSQPSRSRKSVDFGTTFVIPVVSNVKPLVFLRVNPLLVQSELIAKLSRGHLEVSHEKVEANSVGGAYAFCFCSEIARQMLERSSTESRLELLKKSVGTGIYSSCKRKKRFKLSPKMCMYELVLQLSLEFLFSCSSVKTWDRNVGLLLRLENIHGSLTNEVLQQMKDATAVTPRDDIMLSPDDVLLEQDSYCRIRVVIDCVSNLYRLELKRRNQVKTATLGDKKYWYLIHLFRTELRDFNEYLESYADNDSGDDDGGDASNASEGDCGSEADKMSDADADASTANKNKIELLAHIAMFRWIPKPFMNEWIVLSLEDFLQTVGRLSTLLERSEASGSANLEHVQYACQLLQIFELIMTRSTDADVQTLLVRVLNRGCYPITTLLRQLATVELTLVDHFIDKRKSYMIQATILGFLGAFATLDVALPTKNRWAQRNPDATIAKLEDIEVLEQRKGALMASVLVTSGGVGTDEPSLWEYMVLTLVRRECLPPLSESQKSWTGIPILSVVSSFQQRLEPSELSLRNPAYFRHVEVFLRLMAQFYASTVSESAAAQVDFGPCVTSHMHYVVLYSKRYKDSSAHDNPRLQQQVAAMHLKCLVALATRRAQVPAITAAFAASQVVSTMLELVLDSDAQQVPLKANASAASDLVHPLHATTSLADAGVNASTMASASADIDSDATTGAAQGLVPSLRLNLNNVQKSAPRPDAQSQSDSSAPARSLLLTPEIHALVVVLIASVVILEPNFELDEALCPRFAIASEAVTSSSDSSLHGKCSCDLLWTLQQHLASVNFCVASFESTVRDLEATHVVPTAARISAIRSFVRLAVPSLFDRAIYVTSSAPSVSASAEHSDAASADERADGTTSEPVPSWTYIAKGAFSTVYRSTPMLPRACSVAVKVVAHQARPGDFSVLKNLYNEVSVLTRLQGEPAATQMFDYGNHDTAQSFEVMMEYCPCTLMQWRATLGSAPFRSLLVIVLRAFEYICQALALIHREGVGHFDVKGDNVLIRTIPHDVTRRLLLYEERESYESEAARFLKTCFCFGDFGESMVAESDLSSSRTHTTPSSTTTAPLASPPALTPLSPTQAPSQCFVVSRTRGTEAIKSPEMLRISGADCKKAKVTFACDLWSMGCLLYELITQELLFGNDDAAGLYTHLVTGSGRVLRDDHDAKISAVLAPKDELEKLLVYRVVVVCEKMLARDAAARLSLEQILVEVRRLLEDALALTKSAEDKKYLDVALGNEPSTGNADESRDAQRTSPGSQLRDLPSYTDRQRSVVSAISESEQQCSAFKSVTIPTLPLRVQASRFFWNLHIGDISGASSSYLQALTRAGAGDRATSATTAFMDAFEAVHEATYDSFVYFLWDSDANARFDAHAIELAPLQSMPSLVNEVSEENGRTCLFINSSWITLRHPGGAAGSQQQQQRQLDLGMKFFRQVDLDSHQIFPVFQRLLRQEPGSVLLLGVGRDAQALEIMNEVLTSTLLFFLQSAFSLGTTEALAFLARDCSQLFGYPSTARLLEFEAYAARHDDLLRRVFVREKVTNRRYVARCFCGESAFAVPIDAIKEAMYHQQQQCSRSAIQHSSSSSATCTCFHPFPSPTALDCASEQTDELYCAAREMYNAREERLMFPLESQSRRGDQVAWAEVDIGAVERLDSLFGAEDVSSGNGSSVSVANVSAAPLSSRGTAQQSARSSAPLIVSFRELRRRRRHQIEEQSQLAGVGEHSEQLYSHHNGVVCALTLGLKERAYDTAQLPSVSSLSRTASSPSAVATAKPRKLYECELCCFPICAISSDHEKVALPLYLGR